MHTLERMYEHEMIVSAFWFCWLGERERRRKIGRQPDKNEKWVVTAAETENFELFKCDPHVHDLYRLIIQPGHRYQVIKLSWLNEIIRWSKGSIGNKMEIVLHRTVCVCGRWRLLFVYSYVQCALHRNQSKMYGILGPIGEKPQQSKIHEAFCFVEAILVSTWERWQEQQNATLAAQSQKFHKPVVSVWTFNCYEWLGFVKFYTPGLIILNRYQGAAFAAIVCKCVSG